MVSRIPAKRLRNKLIPDWRLQEVRILLLALVIAVMSITSVSFFTDRVERAMQRQGSALIGADLVVRSTRPIQPKLQSLTDTLATTHHLQRAESIEFNSVALSEDDTLLAEVKAVSPQYPLRGAVKTSDSLDASSTSSNASETSQTSQASLTPPQGFNAWADPEVFYRLGLQPGDSIQLGEQQFTLSRVITLEPDAGGSVFRLAPRILIAMSSLAKTQLIQAASRAKYKLLLAGEADAIQQAEPRIKAALSTGETLESVSEGRPEVSQALSRATRFMKLAAVLTVIISGAAVALTVLSYLKHEASSVATLKSLGASRRQLWLRYGKRFAPIILLATLIGSLLGFLIQFGLAALLENWLNISLPRSSLWPISAGLATAILTLMGFAWPALIRLMHTSPMQILRAETTRWPSQKAAPTLY